MKSWLVTIDGGISDDEAFRRLRDAGAEPDHDSDVVRFADEDRAVCVFASDDVAAGLQALDWVRDVFPNSDMQAY